MKRKIISVFFIFVLLLSSSYMAFGIDNYQRIYDYSKKLTTKQNELLTNEFKKIEDLYNLDILAMTIDSDDNDAIFGYKIYSQIAQLSDRKNAIFLYIEDDGTCNVSAYGQIVLKFSEKIISSMEQQISDVLSQDGYEKAFEYYSNLCQLYLENEEIEPEQNEELNQNQQVAPNKKGKRKVFSQKEILGVVISIICGFIVSFVICYWQKNKMSNIGLKTDADDYLEEKLLLTVKKDKIIKRTVSKRKLENNK